MDKKENVIAVLSRRRYLVKDCSNLQLLFPSGLLLIGVIEVESIQSPEAKCKTRGPDLPLLQEPGSFMVQAEESGCQIA